MNRPLIIGQAPGPNTDPELPLFPVPSGSAGGRLQSLMGLTRGQYLKRFDRVNLLPFFPGKCKRDDKFPMTPAKLAARAIRPLLAGRTVVLLGRNVANAFLLDLPFHEWTDLQARRRNKLLQMEGVECDGVARLAIVPHTSGRSHWYNKEENKRAAVEFWRVLLDNMQDT